MDWELKKELKEQLQEEQGYYIYPVGTRTRFALVYPNSYFVGMSNLGFHIIYDLLNKRQDTACERVFLPERTKIQRYINTRTPIMSIETQSPLYDFDVLGFAVSFEMDYFRRTSVQSLTSTSLDRTRPKRPCPWLSTTIINASIWDRAK